MRFRQKNDILYEYYHNESLLNSYPISHETFHESAFPGSNSCLHQKSGFTSGAGFSPAFNVNIRVNNQMCSFVFEDFLPLLDGKVSDFNWNKLPSSSQFGIIQILSELDDTIALFTRKFWSQLSYGSLTWGVIPFVSDVKAVLTAVENLSRDLSKFSYEDEVRVPVALEKRYSPYDLHSFVGEAVVRHTGFGDLSFQNEASVLLDRLGFHPDLATAWDLVPLSFVVDYLIPVGDFLEGFRQGGWVKCLLFNGWRTIKVTGRWTINHHSLVLSSDYEGFNRIFRNQLLTAEIDNQIDFQLPSLREMFNILYLLKQKH